ncbi:MAG TPA: glycosyltransferase, partial [Methylovirgula sp.]
MDAKKRSPRVYLDLTDVILHGTWYRTPGGIARVQFEIAAALLRENPAAIAFSLDNRGFRDLRPLFEAAGFHSDAFFEAVHKRFFFRREYPRLSAPRHLWQLARGHAHASLERLRTRPLKIGQGDTLLIGGCFWLLQSTMNLIPRACAQGAQVIVFFHDLIPFTHPEFTGNDFAAEYGKVLCAPAHFIVTTPFNRAELERLRTRLCSKADALSASVVPLADEFPGAKRNARPALPGPRLAKLVGHSFVLSVGTIEIRKNHAALMSAWEDLAGELKDELPTLVISGRRGWKADETLQRLDETQRTDGQIVFIEAPSEDELRWLYASCLFTVLPSLFEGWGLPLGESYWFGKTC